MVANTNIKFFVHTNIGAPQLSNESGKLISVLDACLVNGFGLQSVSSLTTSGTTATVVFPSAHNFMRFQVIRISGANQSEFNGEHCITSIPDANSVSFELARPPSTSIATGLITCDLAPLGWKSPFSAAGRRAYRNNIPGAPFLRVIDEVDPVWPTTYSKYAKVGICEDMTDINTIIGHQAPFDPTKPDKNWIVEAIGSEIYGGWAKWHYATNQPENNANAMSSQTPANGDRSWTLVGDGETFFIFNRTTTGTTNETPIAHGFGSLKNVSKTAADSTFLAACDGYVKHSSTIAVGFSPLTTTAADNGNKLFLFRNYKGEANYAPGASRVFGGNSSSEICGAENKFSIPGTDVGVFSSEYLIVDNSVNPPIPRGIVPLLRWIHQTRPYSNWQTFIESGRKFIAIPCLSLRNSGQILVDLGEI